MLSKKVVFQLLLLSSLSPYVISLTYYTIIIHVVENKMEQNFEILAAYLQDDTEKNEKEKSHLP